MVEEKKEIKQQEKKPKYEIVQVTTESQPMIREVGTENLMDNGQVLLKILNDVADIKKSIC